MPAKRPTSEGWPNAPADVATAPTHAAATHAAATHAAATQEPRHRGGAGAPASAGVYSTVTDLARFRGWSTSKPLALASSQAKSCSGTVASNGISSVGV